MDAGDGTIHASVGRIPFRTGLQPVPQSYGRMVMIAMTGTFVAGQRLMAGCRIGRMVRSGAVGVSLSPAGHAPVDPVILNVRVPAR